MKTKNKCLTELYAEGVKSTVDNYTYGPVYICNTDIDCIQELNEAFGNSTNLGTTEHFFCLPTFYQCLQDMWDENNPHHFTEETQVILADAYKDIECTGNSTGYIMFRS